MASALYGRWTPFFNKNLFFQGFYKPLQAVHALFQHFVGITVRYPEKIIGAETLTRRNSQLCLVQKPCAESHRSHAEAGNAGENIKCAC